ncbi:hypothetical protein MKZ38_006355 [Zalerion maritima]|uniref:Uncharacterized protein n=1 Tax=Zalerion maritima TaxID=339359 RepID=A0AAD5RX75_9PEZI|nr:hypothetical protein MKZ38_006355 [Zalerion maritima]
MSSFFPTSNYRQHQDHDNQSSLLAAQSNTILNASQNETLVNSQFTQAATLVATQSSQHPPWLRGRDMARPRKSQVLQAIDGPTSDLLSSPHHGRTPSGGARRVEHTPSPASSYDFPKRQPDEDSPPSSARFSKPDSFLKRTSLQRQLAPAKNRSPYPKQRPKPAYPHNQANGYQPRDETWSLRSRLELSPKAGKRKANPNDESNTEFTPPTKRLQKQLVALQESMSIDSDPIGEINSMVEVRNPNEQFSHSVGPIGSHSLKNSNQGPSRDRTPRRTLQIDTSAERTDHHILSQPDAFESTVLTLPDVELPTKLPPMENTAGGSAAVGYYRPHRNEGGNDLPHLTLEDPPEHQNETIKRKSRKKSIEIGRKKRQQFSDDSEIGAKSLYGSFKEVPSTPSATATQKSTEIWREAVSNLEDTVSNTMRLVTKGMLRHIQTRAEAIKSVWEQYQEIGTRMVRGLLQTHEREAIRMLNSSGTMSSDAVYFWSECDSAMEDIARRMPSWRDIGRDQQAVLNLSGVARSTIKELLKERSEGTLGVETQDSKLGLALGREWYQRWMLWVFTNTQVLFDVKAVVCTGESTGARVRLKGL